MPARGDHDARRRDVSEAVWRVLAGRGFGGLTLRAVAAEMDASTGLLTHYFPNKRALVAYALDLADERTASRALRKAPPGLASLRAALLDVLPLTPAASDMNRIWVSSWDVALADPELGEHQRRRYENWRARLRPHAAAAVERGELPAGPGGDDTVADDTVAAAAAFTHGLVVHALFDPDAYPPARQTAMLDAFLAALATGSGPPAAPGAGGMMPR
ncbi:TetR/AcrR family transcriptional regulator [Actinomadura mexicana]|uniref:Transcriptional regulator, TetR family n=1 Tax=Actinomadura mexicana TaxID=134959 RepID=A0A239CAR7_9ACTN|nr:TetR family transcriptional regulator C-terminal domain-containing protein [Actinomadura mexicana]SNS17059.1 transcriptional regulator, TetR family [Actinomadura mexicana]